MSGIIGEVEFPSCRCFRVAVVAELPLLPSCHCYHCYHCCQTDACVILATMATRQPGNNGIGNNGIGNLDQKRSHQKGSSRTEQYIISMKNDKPFSEILRPSLLRESYFYLS